MNCDPLARWYAPLEYLSMGSALQRRRCEFLAETAGARSVLLLGDGDGRFLERLREANPSAAVDSVDASKEMLSVARARVSGSAGEDHRITFHHADARWWMPPAGASYDVVATHFFLDCFDEADAAGIIRTIAAATRPGGKWIVSEFRIPSKGWASRRARVWVGGLYRVFGWVTGLEPRRLPCYGTMLGARGFIRTRLVSASAGMLVSELWEKTSTLALAVSETAGEANLSERENGWCSDRCCLSSCRAAGSTRLNTT